MNENNKRIAKNTIVLYFRMFIVMGISLATAGITMRVLGQVDYGLNNVLGGIVAMFTFLNGSLSGAASRYITFELGRKDFVRLNKIFNVSLVVHLALAAVLVLLCETVGLWFFYNKMVIPPERMTAAFWVVQISIIGLPLSLSQVPYGAVLIAHENMKMFAYTSIADQVARLAILGALVISPYDKLITLSLLGFSWGMIMMIFYRVYCIKLYPETKLRFCGEKKLYADMFAFAGSDLIGCASCMLQGQGFNLLLNTFFGPVINAARGIAYGMQGMVTQFSGGFMTAAAPQIIKLYAEGNLAAMWKLVERSSCFSYYLILLLALPACLEADFLLKTWLGNYPDHTINFMVLVIIFCMIQTVKTPRVRIFHATGHLFILNSVVGTMLCLAFPIAWIILRMGGSPESVFVVANVILLLTEIVSPFILIKYVPMNILRYFCQVHLRCFVVTVLACIAPVLLYGKVVDQGFLRCAWTGLLSTISVGVTSFCVGMDRESRQKCLELIKSRMPLKNRAVK